MFEFVRRRFLGSKKVKHRNETVKPTLEGLETRFVPNASPFFGGLHALGFGGPAHVGGLTGGLGDPSGPCQGQSQTQTLAAALTGSTGSGSVTFNANSTAGTNNLLVKVSGLTAATTYSVTSGSTTLGTITTSANGSGQLLLSNISPALTAGATVSVLDPSSNSVLTGTLATPSSIKTQLSASLTSPGGATGVGGTASFNANTLTGQSNLSLRITGLTPDSTYTVQVGGTSVDQIYSDAFGNGRLSVSNVSPTAASGSTIAVLDSTGTTVLSGTFATETSSGGPWGHHH